MSTEPAAVEIPGAVELNIAGMPVTYVNVDPQRTTHGFDMMLAAPGELAPFLRGRIVAGTGVLLINPEVHARLRDAFRGAIAKARQAGAGGNGAGGGA